MKNLEEVIFGIIVNAGEAKSIAFEAISQAKEGKHSEALELIEKAKDTINKTHHYQTELIQAEAGGEKVEIGVLLIHSQDHLMTSMTFVQLAEEIISLHQKIDTK